MSNKQHRFADLVVVLLLAIIVAAYCYDAFRASADILNLIIVLPLSAILLVLCTAQFLLSWRADAAAVPDAQPVSEVLPVIGLFGAYVLSLHWFGFDIGTFLFVATFLWLQGERRKTWLVAYSLVFAFALSFFFSAMLPYPMPMMLLSTAY